MCSLWEPSFSQSSGVMVGGGGLDGGSSGTPD